MPRRSDKYLAFVADPLIGAIVSAEKRRATVAIAITFAFRKGKRPDVQMHLPDFLPDDPDATRSLAFYLRQCADTLDRAVGKEPADANPSR